MRYNIVLLISAAFLLFSCNGEAGDMEGSDSTYASTTTRDTLPRENSEMATVSADTLAGDIKNFIHQAATNGMLEVKMAQLAIKNASNDAVRNLAKTIADQHIQLNNKLKDIAGSKNIALPGDDSLPMQDMNDLTGKTGTAFDSTYLRWVIREHQRDIEELKRSSAYSNDDEIKQFAAVAIPMMQQHLDAAVAIKF